MWTLSLHAGQVGNVDPFPSVVSLQCVGFTRKHQVFVKLLVRCWLVVQNSNVFIRS